MKANQLAAIKKLEAALLSCKRAGLVLVGIDDSLLATVDDDWLENASRRSSACEAVLERHNTEYLNRGPSLIHSVKDYGCYRDSGGA